jgi:nucleoside-diphosphate-sugar epimerase
VSKNVLITGGFGFLGTHLIDEILEHDKETKIHIVDDFSTSPFGFEKTLQDYSRSNLTYEKLQVRNSEALNGSGPVFHEVYHLASYVGPAGVLKHGGEMIRGIVDDGYRIIDYCLKNNSRMLLASSSEIYGGGVNGLCAESTNRVVPAKTTIRLEYAVGKIAIETAVINKTVTSGLSSTIIRPFNVAGPRQSGKGGFVLPRFIAAAMENRPLTVFGDGQAKRAFTHVRDIANGCYLAMKSDANGEVYNLGNPVNKITIKELAEMVTSIVGSHSKIHFTDPKTLYGELYEEASDKFPDSQKAKTMLNWEPKHSVASVILETWKFMQTLSDDDFREFAGV